MHIKITRLSVQSLTGVVFVSGVVYWCATSFIDQVRMQGTGDYSGWSECTFNRMNPIELRLNLVVWELKTRINRRNYIRV